MGYLFSLQMQRGARIKIANNRRRNRCYIIMKPTLITPELLNTAGHEIYFPVYFRIIKRDKISTVYSTRRPSDKTISIAQESVKHVLIVIAPSELRAESIIIK